MVKEKAQNWGSKIGGRANIHVNEINHAQSWWLSLYIWCKSNAISIDEKSVKLGEFEAKYVEVMESREPFL